jgi:hypothetical protein
MLNASRRIVVLGLSLGFAAAHVSAAEKLPVFKVTAQPGGAARARGLLAQIQSGARLAPETQRVERAGVVGFRAGSAVVEIEQASGGVFAANLAELWNPGRTPTLPARAQARLLADTFLAENKLLPARNRWLRISAPVFSETGLAVDGPNKDGKRVLDTQVNYRVEIAVSATQSLPVVGGGDFKVALGDKGRVIGYSGAWRPIAGVVAQAEVLSQAAAEAQFKKSARNLAFDEGPVFPRVLLGSVLRAAGLPRSGVGGGGRGRDRRP